MELSERSYQKFMHNVDKCEFAPPVEIQGGTTINIAYIIGI